MTLLERYAWHVLVPSAIGALVAYALTRDVGSSLLGFTVAHVVGATTLIFVTRKNNR